MIMAASYPTFVFAKKEITMENFAQFIVPLTATTMKYIVQDKETRWDVLNQISV
jgi:hypothetical protein